MKILFTTFIFLFLITDDKPVSEWLLIDQQEGINLYERWIKINEEKVVRERKGEMTLNCSSADVINLICDVNRAKNWMNGILECYIIKKVNEREFYTYTLYDIPWPFNNRDLVSHFTIEPDLPKKRTYIKMSSIENYIPIKKNISRLKDYHAVWEIIRINEQSVRVLFNAVSETPPIMPRWIQDPVVNKILMDNLKNFKEIVTN